MSERISATGLRLAMLETTRQQAEKRLTAQIAALNAAILAKEAAQREVENRLRNVICTRTHISETTDQMHQLVHRSLQ